MTSMKNMTYVSSSVKKTTKMTNKDLIEKLQETVDKYGELPIQIIYEDVNLIGEDIRVELDQSCSKNSKAISIYTE